MGQGRFSARAVNQIVAAAAIVCFSLISAPKAGAANSNWYVGASIPVMYIDDTDTITKGSSAADLTAPTPPSTYSGKAVNKYDTGYKLEGVIGYELGSNVRVELELFYSEADVDKLTYSDVSTTILGPQGPLQTFDVSEDAHPPVSGSAEQIGAMLNLWYDIDLGSKWTPYVGIGIGVIEVDFSDVKYDDNALAQHVANEVAVIQARATNPGVPREALLMGIMNDPRVQLPPGYAPKVSTTDTVFAYQAAAGVSYQFRDNLVLRLGYRYQASDDLKFRGKNNFGNTVNTKTDFDVQFIEIGFRYHF